MSLHPYVKVTKKTIKRKNRVDYTLPKLIKINEINLPFCQSLYDR